MKFSFKAALCLIAIAGTGLVITACTYTDPAGREHSLTPYRDRGPAQDDKWKIVGCFTDEGETYCLIDTDGDGKVDLIKRMRDGKLIQPQDPFDVNPTWLTPPQQNPKPTNPTTPSTPSKPSGQPGGAGTSGGGGGGTTREDGGREAFIQWVQDLFLINDLANPEPPFNFGAMSAAQWIERYGLDVPADVPVTLDNVWLHSIDTDTHHTEVTIYWSGRFIMPDLDIDGRTVNYTLYSREGVLNNPSFVVMHLSGQAEDVLSVMVDMGTHAFSFDGPADSEGNRERLTIEAQPGSAILYRDGAVHDIYVLP